MYVKNLTKQVLNAPGGRTFEPGENEYIPDAEWSSLRLNPIVKKWVNNGLLQLNGVTAPPAIPLVPAPEGGHYGRTVVLADEAAYNALSTKDPMTVYVWPDPEV